MDDKTGLIARSLRDFSELDSWRTDEWHVGEV